MAPKPNPGANEAPTSMPRIFREVRAYHEKMNLIAEFLETHNADPSIRIDKDKEYIGFYIGKAAMGRLQQLMQDPDCQTIAVYLGLADEKQHCVTGCFVAIDANRQIIETHFSDRAARPMLMGEDTWIPPGGGGVAAVVHEDDDDGELSDKDLKLSVTPADLRTHFRQP